MPTTTFDSHYHVRVVCACGTLVASCRCDADLPVTTIMHQGCLTCKAQAAAALLASNGPSTEEKR